MPAIIEPMHYLRKERNRLLVNSDWEMTRANETGEGVDELKTYRQKLRDLPTSAEGKDATYESIDAEKMRKAGKSEEEIEQDVLEVGGELKNVTWPTKP